MQPSTLERALHRWPLWEESILKARAELNFKSALLKSEQQTAKWEKDVGWDKAIDVCLEALQKMELPWYLGFYWLACFCADYRKGQSVEFSQITLPPQNVSQAWGWQVREQFVKDRGIVMLYHKMGVGEKLYPPYPFLLETSFPFGLERGKKPSESEVYGIAELDWGGKKVMVDGLFEVNKNGNVTGGRKAASIIPPTGTYQQIFFGEKRRIPPEFRVEFPMFLASEDVVSFAFKQIQAYREGFKHYIPHPLLKYIGEAKVTVGQDILETRHEAKRDIDLYERGELNFEGLIYSEWERELGREGMVASRLKHRHMSLSRAQTAIYHRVRRRLIRRGIPPPKPKPGWRSQLNL